MIGALEQLFTWICELIGICIVLGLLWLGTSVAVHWVADLRAPCMSIGGGCQ